MWMRSCEQNIACADGYAHAVSRCRIAQWHFDFAKAATKAYAHHALGFTQIDDRAAEEIFKPGRLRQPFAPRGFENFHGSSLPDHATVIHGDQPLAEHVHF